MRKHKRALAGVLLALLGGTFGLHRFYLNDRRGLFYVLLCWTGLPTLAGVLEAADMPRRVRIYEADRGGAEAARERWISKHLG